MLVRYILSSVRLRLSQFSQLSFMQYMGLCVFSLPVYLMMSVRIRVLNLIIIIKSEVWLICHSLGLGHETMTCAVCLSIFLNSIMCMSMGILAYLLAFCHIVYGHYVINELSI